MAIQSHHLEPIPDGTRLSVHFKLKMPLPRQLTHLMARFMLKRFKAEEQYDTLMRMIAEEAE